MKQISFVVPCYNSEEYMEHCIDSLLIDKKDIEIIIIDDGSKDKTGKIADNYKRKYPDIVKVVHQENGGHGEGINQGLKKATGRYFKVVDSDDWLDEESLKTLLKKIKDINTDLIVTNYVYTYTDGRKNQSINFSNVFDENKALSWDDIHRFKTRQYLMLHSLIFKKDMLDRADIELPKHVFYEDNLFVYMALRHTESIYYMNLDLYHYFIGREDQSVQEPQLIKRSSHQVLVSTRVGTLYNIKDIKNKKHYRVMKRHLSLFITLAIVFSRLSKSDSGEKQYKDMLKEIKAKNIKVYRIVRNPFTMSGLASIPGKAGRWTVIKGYRIAHKLVNFN